MKKYALSVCLFAAVFNVKSQSNMNIDQKVSTLLSKMTLEEKVGQMTQISVEAFLKSTNGKLNEPHEFDMTKLTEAIS